MIGLILQRTFHVRPGERWCAHWTFLYVFLLMGACAVIQPVGRALILGELGARAVPYGDLLSAMLISPILAVFTRLGQRLHTSHVVSFWCGTMTGMTLWLWSLLQRPLPWAAGACYVWSSICTASAVVLCWRVLASLYPPDQLRRLGGIFGCAGLLGGVVGSAIVALSAPRLGTAQLLLIAAGWLAACWIVGQHLCRRLPSRPQKAPSPPPTKRTIAWLAQSRYLVLLAALVATSQLVSTLLSYQTNWFIELLLPDQEAKTVFLGAFLGGIQLLTFVIQFFLTSWILRRLGLAVALLVLPVGLLLGAGGLLAAPVFWLAAFMELYDGSMTASLQQATNGLLLLPMDSSIRSTVTPFMQTIVRRAGQVIAAILGLIALGQAHGSVRWVAAAALASLVLWMLIAIWVRRSYAVTVRTVLQAQTMSRQVDPSLMPFARKVDLIRHLLTANASASSEVNELLEQLRTYEAPPASVAELGSDASQLKAVLGNPTEPLAKRRQAIRWLSVRADQRTVDYLVGFVTVEPNPLLRQDAVEELVKWRVANPWLEVPNRLIRRQIAGEVARAGRITQVAGIYRQHYRAARMAEDPVCSLLRLLLEESREQVVRLLMFLNPSEDLRLIGEQIRASDPQLRADAVALLTTLIDPAMRQVLSPILEDDFVSQPDGTLKSPPDPAAAYRVLQEAIWEGQGWLSVTTLCAVGQLRVTTMRQELERAAHDAMPLRSAAGRVALSLSNAQ